METKSKITIRDILIAFLAPLSVAIYNVAFLYLNNIGEASLSDTFMPLTISAAIAAVSMAVLVLITKDAAKSAIIAAILYFVAINYALFEKAVQMVFNGAKYWHLMPIAIVLFLHIAYFIIKFMSKDMAKTVSSSICFVFSALIVVNILTNVQGIANSVKIAFENDSSDELQVGEVKEGLPNVYMFLLDEYSNFDTIEKYYGYDNSEFHDFLVNKGFTVSEHSSNERQNGLTVSFTTNYLNLDYVAFDTDVYAEVLKKRINPPLFKILNENGYSIHHYGNSNIVWNGSYGEGSNNTENKSRTMDGKSFSDLFFSNNIFYVFLQPSTEGEDRQKWINEYNYIMNSFKGENKSRFVYCHTEGGHSPFVFDENGGAVPQSERENWVDGKYYLGQYKYVTSEITKAIDYLTTNDPNAVIILMSDHSMRNKKDANGNHIIKQEDKVVILNAVYFGGQPIPEINNQSGVNSLRLVLNKLFGLDLEILPMP